MMISVIVSMIVLQGDVALVEEHADLKERLDAERIAFDAMAGERKHLLNLLDTLERLALESKTKAQQIDTQLKTIGIQTQRSEIEAKLANTALEEQRRILRPRLLALYRLHKKDSLGFLLTSNNFSNLVKRERGLKRVVKSDVEALDTLFMLSESARLVSSRLTLLAQSTARYQLALANEQAIGKARLSRFSDLLLSVKAEENRQSRLIADLEVSEKELAAMVGDLKDTTGLSGFRALKGTLQLPTDGRVEVFFGKVVNPKFNTVTVQKGLDVAASEGAIVSAVAGGAVAFAGWLKGYGNLVIVDHGNGYHSLYAHLANAQVTVQQVIAAGAKLGQVGDTGSLKGPFLYFEIRKAGVAIDPLPWLVEQGN